MNGNVEFQKVFSAGLESGSMSQTKWSPPEIEIRVQIFLGTYRATGLASNTAQRRNLPVNRVESEYPDIAVELIVYGPDIPSTHTTPSSPTSTPTSSLPSTTTRQMDSATAAVSTASTQDARGDDTMGDKNSAAREPSSGTKTTIYKGKALRSWPQLPPEVVRLIGTFHHLLVSPTLPLPATWELPDPDPRVPVGHRYIPWQEHRLYVAARDMREMELLMTVCPQWGLAMEYHNFWNAALALFDPHGQCAYLAWPQVQQPHHSHSSQNNNSSSKPQRLSPYQHLRLVLVHACLPCRINAPHSSHGLGNASARRATATLRLGVIPLCKDHYERRRGRWCGVCLMDGELGRSARTETVRRAREDLDRAEGLVRWLQAGGGAGAGGIPVTNAVLGAGPIYESRAAAADALARAVRTEAEGQRALGSGAGLAAPGGLALTLASDGITRNEDEAIFPGVHVTCRSCRSEWLWRFAILSAEVTSDPGAVGQGVPVSVATLRDTVEDTATGKEEVMRSLGTSGGLPGVFEPQDRMVRGAVSAWVELGEGTVARVLQVAGERGWLRKHTRWGELMGQAVAAKRWAGDAPTKGGPEDDKPDYTGQAQVVFVTREERERERDQRRARARSASPDSVDDYSRRKGRNDTAAFANNATNAAAYATAGYTNNSADYDDFEEEYDYDDEDDDSLDDFDEEDEEELASALEMNVKEMALGDWARGKILDGAWMAPADVYYNNRVPDHPNTDIPAVHPVAWAISRPPSPPPPGPTGSSAPTAMVTSDSDTLLVPTQVGDQRHPARSGPPPPSYQLAEAAHHAHCRQMRTLLLPAFRNVVRRIIVECALDAAEAAAALEVGGEAGLLRAKAKLLDPAMRAARMSLADVVKQLREEEGIWFDGMDWSAKRRNAREQEQEREREEDRHRERRHRAEGSDGSSAGTPRTSDTSPVLSTSTLGTTPSPPPLGEHRKDKGGEEEDLRRQTAMAVERQPMIAVMPVLESPRLLRPIPHIPETIAHLPSYSMEALKTVWREACAPLYHCRCGICERAMVAAQAAQGGNPTKPAAATPATTRKESDNTQAHKEHHGGKDGPWVMHIPAEDEADERGADSVVSLVEDVQEDEVMSARDRYWKQMEEQEGPGAYEREMELIDDMRSQKWGTYGTGSEDDYEDEDGLDGVEEGGALGPAWATIEEVEMPSADKGRKRSVDELEEGGGDHERERGGTPPKRARTAQPPSVRLVKRRSEELDAADARDAETASTGSAPKRARIEHAESPPDSTSTPGTTSEASAYETELRYPAAR
ncbi:hypothetical protein C8R46DRAFT_1274917 [Mycena filopes]|nr:hypothetical protein C8R46DRAFT_1274917 [Mycena filopes]